MHTNRRTQTDAHTDTDVWTHTQTHRHRHRYDIGAGTQESVYSVFNTQQICTGTDADTYTQMNESCHIYNFSYLHRCRSQVTARPKIKEETRAGQSEWLRLVDRDGIHSFITLIHHSFTYIHSHAFFHIHAFTYMHSHTFLHIHSFTCIHSWFIHIHSFTYIPSSFIIEWWMWMNVCEWMYVNEWWMNVMNVCEWMYVKECRMWWMNVMNECEWILNDDHRGFLKGSFQKKHEV